MLQGDYRHSTEKNTSLKKPEIPVVVNVKITVYLGCDMV
jgi:hypothetical protein